MKQAGGRFSSLDSGVYSIGSTTETSPGSFQQIPSLKKPQHYKQKPFSFNKDQVRILLFRECDWRGRKLLFDSKAVVKVPLDNLSSCKLRFGSQQRSSAKKGKAFVEVSNGYGYQYIRPSSDVNALSEMVFGSVAVMFKAPTLKIHTIKSPSRLLCTKVFLSPRSGRNTRASESSSFEESCASSTNSMSESLLCHGESAQRSHPQDVPSVDSLKQYRYEVDSGICGDASIQSNSSLNSFINLPSYEASPIGTPRSHGSSLSHLTQSSSLSSLQRRWLRNVNTSMEFGSMECFAQDYLGCEEASTNKRTKLGLAVIITLSEDCEEEKQLQSFFFEHVCLIENMIIRLKSAVEKAYSHKEVFVHLLMESCEEMQQSLVDLFSSTRLQMPVWLALISELNHQSTIALAFLNDLGQILSSLDTKNTNFFVSTLVTAVLTHHLGWVPTVLPGTSLLCPCEKNKCQFQSLDSLSQSHPYNPLWAQLGDLHGAVGNPLKLAKTVITGKRRDLIDKLLCVLTYFIRCNKVEEVEFKIVDTCQSNTESSLGALNWPTLCNVDMAPKYMKKLNEKEIQINGLCGFYGKHSDESTLKQSSGVINIKRTASCVSNLQSMSDNSVDKNSRTSGIVTSPKVASEVLEGKDRSSGESFREDSSRSKCCIQNDFPRNRFVSFLKERFCGSPSTVNQNSNARRNYSLIGSSTTSNSDHRYCDFELQDLPNNNNDIATPSNNPRSDKCEKVIFVLGENEQLVNLVHEKPLKSTDDRCVHEQYVSASDKEANNENRNNADTSNEELLDSISVDYSNEKVVTVRASVIEMESEEGNCGILLDERPNGDCIPNSDSKCELERTNSNSDSELIEERNRYLKDYHSVRFQFEHCENVLDKYLDQPSDKELEDSNKLATARRNFDQLNQKNCQFCRSSSVSSDNNYTNVPESDISTDAAANCICSECVTNAKTNKSTSDESSGHFHHSKSLEKLDSGFYSEEYQEPCLSCREKYLKDDCIVNSEQNVFHGLKGPKFISLPLPRCAVDSCKKRIPNFASSLFGSTSDHFIPDLIIQGCTQSPGWEHKLRRELVLSASHGVWDQEVSESVCIVADTEAWEVQLISSQTYITDKPGTLGVRIGMSQLVANMLESFLHLWKLRTPPEYCLLHLESKLREVCLRSRALAEFLLTTEFCDMEQVTSALSLEVNDVPLLLAVASTHTPQVTQRYGLTFK